jgi:hypothetical protein
MKILSILAILLTFGATANVHAQTNYQIAGVTECVPLVKPSPSPTPSNWPRSLSLKKITIFHEAIYDLPAGVATSDSGAVPIRYADRSTWYNQSTLLPALGRDIRASGGAFIQFNYQRVRGVDELLTSPIVVEGQYRNPKTGTHRTTVKYSKVPTYLGLPHALPIIKVGFMVDGREGQMSSVPSYLALQAVHPEDSSKVTYRTISRDFELQCTFTKSHSCVDGYRIFTCP